MNHLNPLKISKLLTRGVKNSAGIQKLNPFKDIPSVQGNEPDPATMSLLTSATLHEYADRQHQRFGGIFRDNFSVEGSDFVFVSAPELIRAVYQVEGKYPKHPIPAAWTVYNDTHKRERGLLFMDGEEWLKYRKPMNEVLLRSSTSWIEQPIMDETDKLINKIKEFDVIPNLEQLMYDFSVRVILRLMFGINKLGEIENDVRDFISIVHGVFTTTAAVMDIPANLLLGNEKFNEFGTTVEATLNLGNRIIEFGLKNAGNDGLLHKLKAIGVSDDALRRTFCDLVMAAGDTSAFSSQWTLYLLARNLKVQQEVRSEIVKGGADKVETPLVKGAVRESLRIYSVAPFIGRFLNKDTVLGEYQIKQDNTLVLISMLTAGRDNAIFPNADLFKPERWVRNISGQYENVVNPNGSMPFAIGARSCVGRKVAQFQQHCLISKLLRNYELHLVNTAEVKPELRLVTVPSEEIKIKLKKLT